MKVKLLLPLLLFGFLGIAKAQPGFNQIEGKTFNYFHLSTQSKDSNLLIFLHGSVSYYVNMNPRLVDLGQLVEHNEDFFKVFENYEIILPIVNSKVNWLEKENIDSFVKGLPDLGRYKTVTIAGFSDGATGAYKIFTKNLDLFDNLIMFSGYPQHNWYGKDLEYRNIKGKNIFLLSSFKDKVIRYEFAVLEYRKIKRYNSNTFLKIVEGAHDFKSYGVRTLKEVDSVITMSTVDSSKVSNEIIDGFVMGNEVRQVYPLRKSTFNKYGLNLSLLSSGFSKKEAAKINKLLMTNKGVLSIEKDINKCEIWEVCSCLKIQIGKDMFYKNNCDE